MLLGWDGAGAGGGHNIQKVFSVAFRSYAEFSGFSIFSFLPFFLPAAEHTARRSKSDTSSDRIACYPGLLTLFCDAKALNLGLNIKIIKLILIGDPGDHWPATLFDPAFSGPCAGSPDVPHVIGEASGMVCSHVMYKSFSSAVRKMSKLEP